MFSDFNKVFKNPAPQPQQKIPESYAKYISKSLPTGLRYLPEEGGACVIVSDDEKLTIGGLRFNPTEEQEKDLGESCSFCDVLNYIDNSQQPMELVPSKPGFITFNGNEIPIEQFIVYPFLNFSTSGSRYTIIPQKFPPPFAIKISGKEYECSLNFSRVANNSINIHVYETEQTGNPLSIRLCHNIKNNEIQFSMNCNPQAAKTVKELATCASIYNDFIDGRGKINGLAIPRDEKGKKFADSFVAFWEKVMKISDKLGVEFVSTNEEIGQYMVYSVERVYQNLVNHLPTKDFENTISSLKVGERIEGDVDLDELVGKCIDFSFETVEEFDFFGNQFNLYELVGICNGVIKKVSSRKNGGKTIFFKDKSPTEKRFTSTIGFRSQNELDEFKKNASNELINILSGAKEVTEFL